MPANRLPTPTVVSSPQADVPDPGPIYCTVGEVLCRVVFWTEAEWQRLEPADRPALAEPVPGLGWVAPVPLGGPF